MKYGETLRQRSIAAWQTHNIDYQDIKYFIKTNTTPGKGKAVAIPGKDDVNAADFENKLFIILKEQDERITWFVKSKVGEIQRRLAHLEQQIERAVARVSALDAGRTVKRIERYGKIETDILKVGEEIQALSRFVGVQQEAFRKLIKKYKKWTGSAELGYRFDVEVRQQRSSFAHTDLKPLLQRYEELLHAVRTLYQRRKSGASPQPDPWAQPISKSDSRFWQAKFVLENGKRVDFDNLLATMEISKTGKDAVFWVHPENVVELQILLQQYMRSFNACCRSPSLTSALPSPTSPLNGNMIFSPQDTFDVIGDNAHKYLTDRASETAAARHKRSQRAALHARAALENDVSLLTWAKDPRVVDGEMQTCALKRKFIDSVLDPKREVLSRKASISHLSVDGSSDHPEESVEDLQKWLKTHSDITPIAAIISQRARFHFIPHNVSGVVIAALDQHIQFQSGVSAPADAQAVEFPYAVLSIRQEGAQIIDLIRILENSHLVEQVRGFSLEYHAIWQARQSQEISAPAWLPLLSQDLRKVPQSGRNAQRTDSSEFGSQSTTPRGSTATSSEAGGQADHTNVDDIQKIRFTSAADPSQRKPSYKKSRRDRGPKVTERYWNEFDEPSDDEEQHYVIYIDPNYESFWDRAWKSCKQAFGAKQEDKCPEAEPLLYSPDLESGSYEDPESSDDEIEPPNYRISRIYGHTELASALATEEKSVISTIPRLPLACFASSLAILVVAFLLAATGRRKLHAEVDAGVIFAVITSLSFAMVGVASLYRSGAQLKGLVWVMAGTALSLVAIASGGLLAWILV